MTNITTYRIGHPTCGRMTTADRRTTTVEGKTNNAGHDTLYDYIRKYEKDKAKPRIEFIWLDVLIDGEWHYNVCTISR